MSGFPTALALVIVCCIAVTPCGVGAQTPQPAAPATVQELVERASAYVQQYATVLALAVGVEHYTQWASNSEISPRGDILYSKPTTRQTVSELVLVRAGNDWLGFRDVYEVDGKPIASRQDRLLRLFTDSPSTAVQQARRIADESARYNYGALQRNFNVPTTALFFLDQSNIGRFRFWRDGEQRLNDLPTWKIRYEEVRKPTIIRTSAGKDMPVKGTLWIEPATGRVFKTHMQITSEARLGAANAKMENGAPTSGQTYWTERRIDTSTSITVSYVPEAKIGILLPSEMVEAYVGVSARSGEDRVTKIDCRATYSDFKRFETSGRLVTPK